MKTSDDLLSSAIYARDRLNPLLFNYALQVVLTHRPDTMHMPLPSFLGSFPDHFVDPVVFSKLREEATMVEEGNRIPILIPRNFTYSDDQPEQECVCIWKISSVSFNMYFSDFGIFVKTSVPTCITFIGI
jgi:hypothetical protein